MRRCTCCHSGTGCPAGGSDRAVWDGRRLGSAKAALLGSPPPSPPPPPPHPRTPVRGGHQSWPASQQRVPEETAVLADHDEVLHLSKTSLNSLLGVILEEVRVGLQHTLLNPGSAPRLSPQEVHERSLTHQRRQSALGPETR